MIRRRTFMTSLAALAVAGTAAPTLANEPWFFSRNGAVIGGYDVVAYFREGQAVQGRPEFKLMWKGATWHFSSAENREHFEMNPKAYAPQFGGYCAYAVSRGYTATVQPEAWKIVDGKLYLNHSLSVRRLWERDVPGNITKATANWPAVIRG